MVSRQYQNVIFANQRHQLRQTAVKQLQTTRITGYIATMSYDISGERARPGGGGEYPLQDGFGWTNGVTRKLMTMYGHLMAD